MRLRWVPAGAQAQYQLYSQSQASFVTCHHHRSTDSLLESGVYAILELPVNLVFVSYTARLHLPA